MSKRRVYGILGVLVALVVAACGGGGGGDAAPTTVASQPQGDPAAGAEVFASTCASCHGADAKGLPNLGKDLTTSEFVKSLSDAELVAFITQGRPSSDPANTTGVDMPPKGGNPSLTEQDLYDVVAYIRTLEE